MDQYRAVKLFGPLEDDVDAGAAPQLAWLEIDSLVVDETYQRDLKPGNVKTIRKIARNFRWSMFSPVFVSPVEGGKYAIIDGQHRTHAAALCGFSQVPCQIVPMSGAEQAAAFAAVNGMVTKVTSWQIFKAALAAGEDWAIDAQNCARAGNCQLMTSNKTSLEKKPGEIFAVMRFREVMQRQGSPRLSQALRCLMRLETFSTVPQAWDNTVLFPCLSALCQRPHVLDGHDERLELLDMWDIEERVKQENRARARNGQVLLSKKERMETEVLDWLDANCPRRIVVGRAG